MKNKWRMTAAVLLSVAMLFGAAFAVPDVRAAEDNTETAAVTAKSITVWSGCATVTNTGGTVISSAMPGEIVVVTLNAAYLGVTDDFAGWDIFDSGNASLAYTGASTDHQIRFVMPDNNVNINAKKTVNNAKVESSKKAESEAESKSKAESESVKKSQEESEAQSKSESASESMSLAESSSIEASRKAAEESSKYAAQTIRVGSYDLYLHVSGTAAPENFTTSKDSDTFSEPVECFYSSKFKTYAYYAKKNGDNNYYLYNKLADDLIPFVTFTGAGGVNYLVMAPDDDFDLPDEVITATSVNLATVTSAASMIVPAWIAEDIEGAERTLLYLASDDGTRKFFVYESKNGAVTLTEWEKFNAEEETTEEETTEETTTEKETTEESTVVVSTTAAPEKKSGLLKNYVIWLVIIGVIILLLIVAIVVVFVMGRKQEEAEAALDDEDEELPDEDEGDGFITGGPDDDFQPYESSYTRPEQDDLEPFDISFEDAFPEEMGLKNTAAEEIRIDVKPGPGKLNGTFGGAAAKPANPDAFTDTELDDFLSEDDFEVIDFSKK